MRQTTVFPFALAAMLVIFHAGSTLAGTTTVTNVCPHDKVSCQGGPCIEPPPKTKQECHPQSNSSCECPPPTSTSSSGKCSGSPVFLATGEYFNSVTDLQVTSVGVVLRVYRNYESGRRTSGVGGLGWSSPAQSRVSSAVYMYEAPSTYLEEADILLPNGFFLRYTKNTDGTYAPPTGRHDSLVKNPDGSWDLTTFGSRQKYHFAPTGELLSITDRYGNLQNWTYNSGRLDRMTDIPTGRYIQFFYGADGRVSAVQDSAGRRVEYTYDVDGKLSTVKDPLNHLTTYSYTTGSFGPLLSQIKDHWNRVIASITYYDTDRVQTYSENGLTYTYNADSTQKTGAGTTINYSYLANGLITSATNRYNGTTTIEYNPDYSVQQVTNELGVKTVYAYNNNGTVASVIRDYQGPLTVQFDIVYDSNFPERVVSVTPRDPSTGNLNTDWQAWHADYYPPGSTAPGALHHIYRVRSDGATLDTLVTFTYNAYGQPISVTDAAGSVTTLSYDSVTKAVSTVTHPRNSTGGANPFYQLTHDLLGRTTSVTDPLGRLTSASYDDLDRITSLMLPKPSPGSTLEFDYSYAYDTFDAATGLVFSNITDPNGQVWQLGYDQFGRLARFIDPQLKTTNVNYANETSVSFNGLADSVTFQRRGNRLIPAKDGITFDVRGRVLSRTDGLNTTTYSYDTLDRIIQRTYGSGQINYTYVGQKLTLVSDGLANETHSFTYDSSYRLNHETQAGRGEINYAYDPADRLTEYAVVGGPVTDYTYYADGSVQTISWTRIPGTFTFTYRLDGGYQQILMPNGQHRDFAFDDQGRLTQIANIHPTVGNLATYDYGYDVDYGTGQYTRLGQRTSMTANVPAQGFSGSLTKYYFDTAFQLIQTDYPNVAPFGGEVDSWSYDAIGRRISDTVNGNSVPYSYYDPADLLQLVGDARFYENYVGRSLTQETTYPDQSHYQYGWNERNRLVSISNAMSASYSYDFRNRRAGKTVSGVGTSFLYAGQNLISQTTGGSASEFLFAPGIDKPLAAYIGGTAYYYSVDGLGSVSLLTNSAGVVQDSYVYDVWGKTRSLTVNVPQPFVYTARETGENGLLYYRARFYDPAIGRFISYDPIRSADYSNFAYVGNDPVNFIDPSGRFFGGLALGSGGAAAIGGTGAAAAAGAAAVTAVAVVATAVLVGEAIATIADHTNVLTAEDIAPIKTAHLKKFRHEDQDEDWSGLEAPTCKERKRGSKKHNQTVEESMDDVISFQDYIPGMPEGWTDQKSQDRLDHSIDQEMDDHNASGGSNDE